MAKYDVMHLDGTHGRRIQLGYSLKELGLTYQGYHSLQELGSAMANGDRARVYVLACKFPAAPPRIPNIPCDLWAPVAIEAIRRTHPDADVILFSDEKYIRAQASEHGTSFILATQDFGPARAARTMDRRIRNKHIGNGN